MLARRVFLFGRYIFVIIVRDGGDVVVVVRGGGGGEAAANIGAVVVVSLPPCPILHIATFCQYCRIINSSMSHPSNNSSLPNSMKSGRV